MFYTQKYFSINPKNLFQKACFFGTMLFFHANIFGQQMVKFETFEIKMSQGGWNIGMGSPQTLMNGTNSNSLQMGTAFAGFNSVIPMQSLNGNSQTNSYYFSNGATTPYNPVLSSNTGGLVEWYVQIKSGQTNVQPGGIVSGRQGMGVVLASSANSNFYTTGNRYALVYGDAAGTTGNGKLQLVAIADGSDYTQSTVICSTSGTLSSFTGGNSHDHFAVKVSYNPTNGEWSLFVRNDGNAFKGPFHQSNYLQVGVPTVNAQFTSLSLNTMAFICNTTNANDRFYFDSYYVFTGIQWQSATPRISLMSNSLAMSTPTIAGKSGCNNGDLSQFFQISGNNLTSNLVVTPFPGSFISLNDTTNFTSSSISITPSNGNAQGKIYVRHNGVSSAVGAINVTSVGAVSKTINVAEVKLGNLAANNVVLSCNDPAIPISVTYTNAGKTLTGKFDPFNDPRAYTITSGMPSTTTTCGFQTGINGIRTYKAQEFQVSQTGSYTFTMRNNSAFDGAGYITTGNFTPGSCATGTWIAGSDNSGATVIGPITLTAGVNYTLFTTTGGSPSTQGCYAVPHSYIWDIVASSGELMLPLITCDNKLSGSVDAYHTNSAASQIDLYSLRVTGMNNSSTCLFSSSTNHNYAVQDFQVSVSGNYTFELLANSQYDGQGYIVKHDPQLTGVGFTFGSCSGGGTFIQGDDNNGEATITNVYLEANKTYTIVTSLKGSEPANNGSYSGAFLWNINGAGNVLIPGVGRIQWFTSPSGGTPMANGGGFNPVGLDPLLPNTNSSGVWTYYAAFANSNNCRTSATYTVNSCSCNPPTIQFASIFFSWPTP